MRTPMILTVIVLALTIRYALVCWLSPFAPCRRCRGLGKTRTRLSRTWRPCAYCRATGLRLRPGRHLINYLLAARLAERTARRAQTRRANNIRPTDPTTGPRR